MLAKSHVWVTIGLICVSICVYDFAISDRTAAAGRPEPLTLQKIQALIQANANNPVAGDTVIAGEIQDNGINFPVDEPLLAQLKAQGAGPKTLAALREKMANNSGLRLRVSVFVYDSCGKYQKQFERLLSSEFRTLPDRFTDRKDLYQYVAKLRVVSENKTSELSLDEINNHWETTNSLQILLGTCNEDQRTAISQVFLGKLSEPLPSIIKVKTRIDPDAYGDTDDFYNVLVLYSLAKDAKNTKQKPDVIVKYLSAAYSIASACKFEKLPPEDPLRNIIRDVRAAIVQTLVKEGAPQPQAERCQEANR